MMDAKIFSQVALEYAAILACIIVALTSFSSLALPVGSIIRESTAFPIISFISGEVFRYPISVTLTITKFITLALKMPLRNLKIFSAINTIYFDPFPILMIITSPVNRLPFATTFDITKKVLASIINFGAYSLYGCFTKRASDFYLSAIPTRSFFSDEIFGLPFVITLGTTKSMFFDARQMSFKFLSAIFTEKIFNCTFPKWAIFTTPIFRFPFRKTFPITEVMLIHFSFARMYFYLFITVITINVQSFFKMLVDWVFTSPFVKAFWTTKRSFSSLRFLPFKTFAAIGTLKFDFHWYKKRSYWLGIWCLIIDQHERLINYLTDLKMIRLYNYTIERAYYG